MIKKIICMIMVVTMVLSFNVLAYAEVINNVPVYVDPNLPDDIVLPGVDFFVNKGYNSEVMRSIPGPTDNSILVAGPVQHHFKNVKVKASAILK